MKILYVITKANWGGAQRYVYDLATAATEAGHEVVVATGGTGRLTECLDAARIQTRLVPALGRDVRLVQDLAALMALRALLRDERPDIVHLNSSKAGFTGALAARLAHVPAVIFTAHGWAFTEDRALPIRLAFMLLHWATILLSSTVIAVSGFVHARAPRFGLPAQRVQLIPLGIRDPDYLERGAAREELIRLDPALAEARDTLWVGTIAELHRNKGIDVGVAGWQKAALTNAAWLVIGGGEDEQELRAVSARAPSIHFLGFVPEAARYLKAFNLFLLPSRTEALGYTILEAGLAGVPVLTSGVGGTREAVGPEYPAMGFFTPEDSDSLAEMLRAAQQDCEYLGAVGERLKEHVRSAFSFDRMVRETLALYAHHAHKAH
jgi:glycosyltransferase involved in cell wall biosynthesis